MAASASTSLNKTLKTLTTLGSGMVLLSFVVVVINQTAGVVQLAKEVNPTLGTVTLWGLLIAYGGLIGVPIVIVMRMPRPLVPPANADCPEFDDHLKRLGERLAINPRVQRASIQRFDRHGIDDALQVLDAEANVIVKQMATTVFLTTAVSQSGRLDTLLVLAAQSRMVWRVAHLYYQRPSLREMVYLYANVAATSYCRRGARRSGIAPDDSAGRGGNDGSRRRSDPGVPGTDVHHG